MPALAPAPAPAATPTRTVAAETRVPKGVADPLAALPEAALRAGAPDAVAAKEAPPKAVAEETAEGDGSDIENASGGQRARDEDRAWTNDGVRRGTAVYLIYY